MTDYLVRSITDNLNVIGLVCVTTDLVGEAARLHRTSPTATAALGRALTGGLLMGALLKAGQRVALKFEGNGPLKRILVEADSIGLARGYVAVPEADVPSQGDKLNVAGVLGHDGFLTVVKDLGLKEPYRGIVKLHTGEIAEDIAYYYLESEQIPSAVGLGVFIESDGRVSAAGGFLIQTFFSGEDPLVDHLIGNVQRIPGVSEFLRQENTPEGMLTTLLSGIPYHVVGKRNLSFRCTCSRERVERALIALGNEELKSLGVGQEKTEVTCEYCRSTYQFTREDLEGLRRESFN